MTDQLQRLEAELGAMRPRPLSPDLVERIEADLTSPSHATPWADRFLMSAIASGAIAACVIVAMLLKPASDAFPSPPPVVANVTSDPPRAGDYSLVIARAEFGP